MSKYLRTAPLLEPSTFPQVREQHPTQHVHFTPAPEAPSLQLPLCLQTSHLCLGTWFSPTEMASYPTRQPAPLRELWEAQPQGPAPRRLAPGESRVERCCHEPAGSGKHIVPQGLAAGSRGWNPAPPNRDRLGGVFPGIRMGLLAHASAQPRIRGQVSEPWGFNFSRSQVEEV